MWRLHDGRRDEAKTRGLLALGLLSIPTGLAALGDPNTYQLLFLAEHIALLIGGYVTNKKAGGAVGGCRYRVGTGLAAQRLHLCSLGTRRFYAHRSRDMASDPKSKITGGYIDIYY